MRVSMSMIASHLAPLQFQADIVDDKPQIEGLRLFSEDNDTSERYVFLGPFSNLFEPPDASQSTFILAHRSSSITLYETSYEQVVNKVLATFDYFSGFQTQLMLLGARHAPAQAMVELAAPVLGNACMVASTRGEVIALSPASARYPDDAFLARTRTTRQLDMLRTMYEADGSVMRNFGSSPSLYRSENAGDYPLIGMYLMADNEPLAGVTCVVANPELVTMDMQLIGLVADTLAMAEEFTGSHASFKSRASVLRDLVGGSGASPDVLDEVGRWSLPEAPWRLVAFEHVVRTDETTMSRLADAIERLDGSCLAFLYEGHVLALMPSDGAEELLAELSSTRPLEQYRIGMSLPFSGLDDLPLRHRQALFALRQRSDPGVRTCEEFALGYLVAQLRTHDAALDLRHPALDILAAHDRSFKAANLHETLYQYLRNLGDVAATSDALGIHRNSLGYRMRRIRELTGVTLKDPDENAYLLVSYLLER